MASFQEQLRAARAAALGRPAKAVKVYLPKTPRPKVLKPVMLKAKPEKQIVEKPSPEKQAKLIMQARKIKKAQNHSEETEIDYTIGAGSNVRAPRLKSKPFNAEGKIMVQLDSRTWVYAKPGYDIKKLREKYQPQPSVKMKYTPLEVRGKKLSEDEL
jgi:hypothetical protein